jgi:hypothetical protein
VSNVRENTIKYTFFLENFVIGRRSISLHIIVGTHHTTYNILRQKNDSNIVYIILKYALVHLHITKCVHINKKYTLQIYYYTKVGGLHRKY